MIDNLERLPGETDAQYRARERKDLKLLIRAVLDSPISSGPVEHVDGEKPLRSFADKNTDLKTRIIIQAGLDAANGEDKSRRFLFEYAGYTPPKEQAVTVDTPQIIFDITPDGESDSEKVKNAPGFQYDDRDDEEIPE